MRAASPLTDTIRKAAHLSTRIEKYQYLRGHCLCRAHEESIASSKTRKGPKTDSLHVFVTKIGRES